MAKSIKLYETEISTLLSLPEESRSHILTAILCDCLEKELPRLDAMENAVFMLIRDQIKRAEELSNRRKRAINSRWTDTSDIQNDTSDIQRAYTNTITNTITSTDNTPPTPSKGVGKRDNQNQGESLKVKTAGGNTNHSTTLDEDFDTFWEAYPKKADKQKALKAWQKLKPDKETLNAILAAVERHKQSDKQ